MLHFFILMFLSRFTKQLRILAPQRPSKKETMVILRDLLEAGTILPVIDRTFPLCEASQAFRHVIVGEPKGRAVIIP